MLLLVTPPAWTKCWLAMLGLWQSCLQVGLCVFNLEAAGGRRRPIQGMQILGSLALLLSSPPTLLTSPDLMGSLAGPRGLLWGGHNSQLTSVPPSVPNLTPSSLPQFLSSAGIKVLA